MLVAAQVLLAAWLLVPGQAFRWQPAGAALAAGGVLLGLWALTANRPGNFRIVPEIKPGARLVQTGPYRWVRHPMYTAVLLLTLGGLLCQFAPLRLLAWLALGAVLYAKTLREERQLSVHFPGYAAYQLRTRRFFPGGPGR